MNPQDLFYVIPKSTKKNSNYLKPDLKAAKNIYLSAKKPGLGIHKL